MKVILYSKDKYVGVFDRKDIDRVIRKLDGEVFKMIEDGKVKYLIKIWGGDDAKKETI